MRSASVVSTNMSRVVSGPLLHLGRRERSKVLAVRKKSVALAKGLIEKDQLIDEFTFYRNNAILKDK